MPPPYSSILFAPTHPANQEPPTPRCCLDAHNKKDYILCTTCPHRPKQQLVEDDWDERLPVTVKYQLPISHGMSQDFEGPLWQ